MGPRRCILTTLWVFLQNVNLRHVSIEHSILCREYLVASEQPQRNGECLVEPWNWRNGVIDVRGHRKIPIFFPIRPSRRPCSTFAEIEPRSASTASLNNPQGCSAQSVNGWRSVVNDVWLGDLRFVRRSQRIPDPRRCRTRDASLFASRFGSRHGVV